VRAAWVKSGARAIPGSARDVAVKVISGAHAQDAERIINLLGDGFEEDSFVIERGHHFVLIEPTVLLSHLEAVIAGRER
jgi:hypothetical protein